VADTASKLGREPGCGSVPYLISFPQNPQYLALPLFFLFGFPQPEQNTCSQAIQVKSHNPLNAFSTPKHPL